MITVVQLTQPVVNLSVFKTAGLTPAKVTSIDSSRGSALDKFDLAMYALGSHGKSHIYIAYYIKAPIVVLPTLLNRMLGQMYSINVKETGFLVEAVVSMSIDGWSTLTKDDDEDQSMDFIFKAIRISLNDLYKNDNLSGIRTSLSR